MMTRVTSGWVVGVRAWWRRFYHIGLVAGFFLVAAVIIVSVTVWRAVGW